MKGDVKLSEQMCLSFCQQRQMSGLISTPPVRLVRPLWQRPSETEALQTTQKASQKAIDTEIKRD